MIAALILVLSAAALIQFFVSYCRSLLVVYSKVELSPKARELAGIGSQGARGDQFVPVIRLVELCPDPRDDRLETHAVRIYYGLVNLLRAASSLAPAMAIWAERERAACAYFAAVALDRRLGCPCEGVT